VPFIREKEETKAIVEILIPWVLPDGSQSGNLVVSDAGELLVEIGGNVREKAVVSSRLARILAIAIINRTGGIR